MDADEKVLEIGKKFMETHDNAFKQLAAIEREELKEELEVLKKKNFQDVADRCMKEYAETYGEMPEDESWMFLEAEYYGTGEGQTLCLQMTQANPWGGDNGDFDRTLPYPDDYKPINTKQYRAVRAFHEQFGTWYLYGLKFLSREDFYTECAYYIPPVMMKLSNAKCFKDFYTRVHYNFS